MGDNCDLVIHDHDDSGETGPPSRTPVFSDGPIATGDGGSTDRHCALREPTTRVDPRDELLERSIGSAKVALLRELEVYDDLIQAMPQVPSCNILTSEEDPAVMALEDFVETDIL